MADKVVHENGNLKLTRTAKGYWLRCGGRSVPILPGAIKALGAAMLVEGASSEWRS